MRMTKPLTALFCNNTTEVGRHHDGKGLYLAVTESKAKSSQGAPTPNKSWILRWGKNGSSSMGLGRLADVSLKEARLRAEELRRQIRQGIDPRKQLEEIKAEESAKSARLTVQEAAEAFIATQRDGWRNEKHGDQWANTLKTYIFPSLGDAVCSEITPDQIRETLAPIWKTKHETASRVRGRLEKILDFAAVSEHRNTANPARLKGVQELLLGSGNSRKSVEHHASMPIDELPAFWKKLEQKSVISAQALKLTILTACRTNEIIMMQWNEIDLNSAIWTIPPERMKAGKQHRVPLSVPALRILKEMKQVENGDYVFWSDRSKKTGHISNMAMLTLLQKNMGLGQYTVHGFRSTFRDWVAESNGLDTEVAEHSLAHQLTDKVVAAYLRTDYMEKRRHMMAVWATYCTTGINPVSSPQFHALKPHEILKQSVQIKVPVAPLTWTAATGGWGLHMPTVTPTFSTSSTKSQNEIPLFIKKVD